jgi:hypothetical protein
MVGAGDSLASARRSVADSAERFAKLPALDKCALAGDGGVKHRHRRPA